MYACVSFMCFYVSHCGLAYGSMCAGVNNATYVVDWEKDKQIEEKKCDRVSEVKEPAMSKRA